MSPAHALRAIRFSAVAVAVLAGTLITGTAPAAAADSLEFVGDVHPEVLRIDLDHEGTPIVGVLAGAMAANVGGDDVIAYCIDLLRVIDVGDVIDEITWEEVGSPNLDIVASILSGYDSSDPASDPAGYELTGSGAVRSAAIQGAVWYYTNGVTTTGPADVAANVAVILDAVAAGVLPTITNISPSVTIDGAPASVEPGQIAGPFVVTGSPQPVTLTPGPDTQLVTWPDGDPLVGPVPSGTAFGLTRSTEGTATVEATTPTVFLRNQVFGRDSLQPLMLIDPPQASASASASASFAAATTTTTAGNTTTSVDDTTSTTIDTTTTSVDDTTSTTVDTTTTSVDDSAVTTVPGSDPSTSTTVAAVVQGVSAERPVPAAPVATQAATQSLPNTGSSTGLLVAGGVVLLAIGGGLLAAGRQPATVSTSGRHSHPKD